MFEMKAIRSALLEIQKAQAWCGNRAINDDDENELDDIKTAEDAIHAAIKCARTTRKCISCRSLLHVRVGRHKSLKWSGGRTCMRAVVATAKCHCGITLGKYFTREPLNWESPLKISWCYLYMLNHNFGIKLILHGTTYSCHLARTILIKDTAGKFSQHAATTKIMSASGRQKLYGVTSL